MRATILYRFSSLFRLLRIALFFDGVALSADEWLTYHSKTIHFFFAIARVREKISETRDHLWNIIFTSKH